MLPLSIFHVFSLHFCPSQSHERYEKAAVYHILIGIIVNLNKSGTWVVKLLMFLTFDHKPSSTILS